MIFDDFPVLTHRAAGNAGTCSTSSPSGNLVGGLPLVAHNTGEDCIGPAPPPYKCGAADRCFANCSRSICMDELSIYQTLDMIIRYRMMYLSRQYLYFVRSYSFAEVRHDGPEFKMFDDSHVFSPEPLRPCVCVSGLALRVPLAVTWLTVYRQLHIPVREGLTPRQKKRVGAFIFESFCALDCSVRMAPREAHI